jgi:hypothetical protein
MPNSSPASAPFWKYMHFSSTPARPDEFSPTKFSSPTAAHSNDTVANPQAFDEKKDKLGQRNESLGDLQDVDLTRGFRQIGKWNDETPEKSQVK